MNYAGITRANYLLENKDKIDFQGKEHIIAEARFLRAYYYFELVKFFGDIPLIIDKRIGIEEAMQLPRTPKAEVYAQIEEDFQQLAQQAFSLANRLVVMEMAGLYSQTMKI